MAPAPLAWAITTSKAEARIQTPGILLTIRAAAARPIWFPPVVRARFIALPSESCIRGLRLLIFWTKFSGQHIPLLAEEGCPRHQKNGSVPICRGRGGQFGTPLKTSRTDHLLRLLAVALALRARLRRFCGFAAFS